MYFSFIDLAVLCCFDVLTGDLECEFSFYLNDKLGMFVVIFCTNFFFLFSGRGDICYDLRFVFMSIFVFLIVFHFCFLHTEQTQIAANTFADTLAADKSARIYILFVGG